MPKGVTMNPSQTKLEDSEKERLDALASYEILDTKYEQEYTDIARFAKEICASPISSICFVDQDRVWSKARVGIETKEFPKKGAFCAETIKGSKPYVIEDTHNHPQHAQNTMVQSPTNIRFYAGVPIITEEGIGIGTINIMDTKPRSITESEKSFLIKLSIQASALLELRRTRFLYENQKMLTEAYKEKISLMSAEIANLSPKDELTDLWNKKSLYHELGKELSRSRRTGDTFVALKFELDHFDQLKINKNKEFCDEIIRSVGNLFSHTTRDTDFCSRINDEQFVVIMPNIDRAKANIAANRLRSGIKYLSADHNITMTASIGVAVVLAAQAQPKDILKLAEKCLDIAKANGGNQIEIDAFYGA